MPTPKVLFILKCSHVMLAPAYGTKTILCGECQGVQPIIGVHTYEWHVKCDTRTCPVGRWTGLSKALALFLASQHIQRHSNHSPKVEYAPNPISVRVEQKLRASHAIP